MLKNRSFRLFVNLVLLVAVFVVSAAYYAAAPAALAANGQPPVNGCQPGANNDIVNEWQLFSQSQFATYLVEVFDYDEEAAEKRAASTYSFCDHNNDGYACVMQQNLPNDASGSNIFWLAEDNHPFGGQ